jgi:hypothetical protein
MMKTVPHRWEFKSRFKRNAFGWRSQPAITRIQEAITEIKRVAKTDAVLGAEGAVLLLERLSPALEAVDSSSGAIGLAVYNVIEIMVPIIAAAPVDADFRELWLERIWQAVQNDDMPYLEGLGDHWGELCADPAIASRWADEYLGITERVLCDERPGAFFKGTTACLSALLFAGRYETIITLLRKSRKTVLLDYRAYAARALAAQGRIDEAISAIEDERGLNDGDYHVARICEPILLEHGQSERAFRDYGFEANRAASYLGTFRTILKKYSEIEPLRILNHCIDQTPGEEGKWFAAARHAGFLELALRLAETYAAEPKTLIVAACKHAGTDPEFALAIGLAALRGLDAGRGYDPPQGNDVIAAFEAGMIAAEAIGRTGEFKATLRAQFEGRKESSLVWTVLAHRMAEDIRGNKSVPNTGF